MTATNKCYNFVGFRFSPPLAPSKVLETKALKGLLTGIYVGSEVSLGLIM